MWKPPIELSPVEEKIVARCKHVRKLFAFLRKNRTELFDEEFQSTLGESYSAKKTGTKPMEPAMVAMATLLQAYCGVSDQDAIELMVMDRRWQMVLDCLGAEEPPLSKGTLFNFRMRMIEHDLDKKLLDRTVELAEKYGGFGVRQLRAALDSTPLVGAGRVEDTLNLLGHALVKAVKAAAREMKKPVDELVQEAGLELVGASSLKAALDLDWSEKGAKQKALALVVKELERWRNWLQQQSEALQQEAGVKQAMKAARQILEQDTEPLPEGEPGELRLKDGVAPDRRISIEDPEMRHGRKSSSKKFNGYKQHIVHDLDSKVIREVVVRPANEPEQEVVELVREELTKPPGLLQLNIDLGYMGSPLIEQWYQEGVYIIARPWPRVGKLFTKDEFVLDFKKMSIRCPGAQTVPMELGRLTSFPAQACDCCQLRQQCTKSQAGRGRSVRIRDDEEFQHKLRAKIRTKRGRASLRKRVGVEHTISHQLAHQGRRVRYRGSRKNQFDGRRHGAVTNLHRAVYYQHLQDAAA